MGDRKKSAIEAGRRPVASQAAIPLMTMTSQRVTYDYDLMDSAHGADPIPEHSQALKHAPIVEPHPRRGTKKESKMPQASPAKLAPELGPAQRQRYKERTMAERVNARLKDEFGASQIRVRGVAKVTAHLMFEVLAPTLDQWLRMAHSRLTTPQWKSNPPLAGPKTSEGRRRSSAQLMAKP